MSKYPPPSLSNILLQVLRSSCVSPFPPQRSIHCSYFCGDYSLSSLCSRYVFLNNVLFCPAGLELYIDGIIFYIDGIFFDLIILLYSVFLMHETVGHAFSLLYNIPSSDYSTFLCMYSLLINI